MARSTVGAKHVFVKARIAAFVIVMLVLLSAAYALMPSGIFDSSSSAKAEKKYPPCPGVKDVAITARETLIEVRSHCLTGRILLPVGHDFVIDAPGELEYFFWNGQRFKVEDRTAKWLGQAPYSTFRLRGTSGQAKLTLTKQ